jgi:hypothetical protein
MVVIGIGIDVQFRSDDLETVFTREDVLKELVVNKILEKIKMPLRVDIQIKKDKFGAEDYINILVEGKHFLTLDSYTLLCDEVSIESIMESIKNIRQQIDYVISAGYFTNPIRV